MEYKKAIVFIDEIHLITRIGAAEGATSVGQLLKPVLSRGDIALGFVGLWCSCRYSREIISAKICLFRKIIVPLCCKT